MRSKGRTFLFLFLTLVMILSACTAPTAAPAAGPTNAPAQPAAAENLNAYKQALPADAAPFDEQILRLTCDIKASETTFDDQVSVYQKICGIAKTQHLLTKTLVTLDKDFTVTPYAAEKWEVSSDGLTWTFHLKPGQKWSDGTALTAADYVATFQMESDPKNAWDFTWFYTGVIKNWDDIVAGKMAPTELGVKAVDDNTLEITTQTPWPALPSMMIFSWVSQKASIEKYGPLYNTDPKTSVSVGPFVLKEHEKGKKVVYEPNPQYTGVFTQPRLKQIVLTYRDMSTMFSAFQNHEIDLAPADGLSPADFEVITKDENLKKDYLRSYGDFRTDYLFFDTTKPPFNDLNVRKAFAYAVDRDAIVKSVFTEIKAMPAHSFLMPGFPASDSDGKLTSLQTYDCAKAKDYLSKAGFPDGKDFPKQEMWLRGEGPAMAAVYQASAASIAQCLNISIEVSNKDGKAFMDALNVRPTTLTFGAVSYGMDYLDPSNMLGLWVSTGRHSWKNEQFDKLVKEASSMTGDDAKRTQMFKDAEKILVDDVGGVFIAHRWGGDLIQPYVMGEGLRTPDKQGMAAWHWGNDALFEQIYLNKDASQYRK